MSWNQRSREPIIKSDPNVNLPPVNSGSVMAPKVPVRISRFNSLIGNRAIILPDKPSVNLPRVMEKNGKLRFLPTPPTNPKPVNANKKRPVAAKAVPSFQRNNKARSLSIVGKTVSLKGEPNPASATTRKSSNSKVKSSVKLGEETAKTSDDSKNPAEAETKKIPRTLDKDKSFKSRIPRPCVAGVHGLSSKGRRTFSDLSAGSNIPVPAGSLESSPRAKPVKQTSPALDDNKFDVTKDFECHSSLTSSPKVLEDSLDKSVLGKHDADVTKVLNSKEDLHVVQEEAVNKAVAGIMDIPERNDERPSDQIVHDDNTSHKPTPNKEVKQASSDASIQPKTPMYQRGKHARLIMNIGKVEMKTSDYYDSVDVVEIPSLFGKFSTKFKKEYSGFRKLRQLRPNTFNLENKSVELSVQSNSVDVSIVKITGFKRETLKTTVQVMMKEFDKLYSELLRVRNETCDEACRLEVKPFDSTTTGIPKTDPTAYVKELGMSMANVIVEIYDAVKIIKTETCDVLTSLQQDVLSTKKVCIQQLGEQDEEIDMLYHTIHEMECSIAEEHCKYASLESLINIVNSENEKLESRVQVFQKELEKARLDWNCKVRELTNLRSDIQRRDTRSSELLDEYSALWKEKNTLSLNVACFEAEMQEASIKRIHLECHNTELVKEIEDLKKQIQENGSETALKTEITIDEVKCQDEEPSTEDSVQVNPVPETITVPVLPEDVFVYDEVQMQPLSGVVTDETNKMDILHLKPIEITPPETLHEAVQRMHALEMAIAERNLQLNEFRKIVDVLKEQNTKLEIEKLEELNNMQGLRLESLQEAKQLRDMEERLQTKDEVIDDLSKAMDVFVQKYNGLLSDKLTSAEESAMKEEEWIAQCKRSCQQTKEIEECMRRQDAMLEDFKNERVSLIKENHRLRAKFGPAIEETLGSLDTGGHVPQNTSYEVNGERNNIKSYHGQHRLDNRPQRKIHFYQSNDKDMSDIKLRPNEAVIFVVKDVKSKGRDTIRNRSSHIKLEDGPAEHDSSVGNGADLDGERANLKHDNPSDTLHLDPIKKKDSLTARVSPKKKNEGLLTNFVRNLSPITESTEDATSTGTMNNEFGEETVVKGEDEVLAEEETLESLKLDKRIASLKKSYITQSPRLLKKRKSNRHREI